MLMTIKSFVIALGIVCFVVRELVAWKIPKFVIIVVPATRFGSSPQHSKCFSHSINVSRVVNLSLLSWS